MLAILGVLLTVFLVIWALPKMIGYFQEKTLDRIITSLTTTISSLLVFSTAYLIRYFYLALDPDNQYWFIAVFDSFVAILLLISSIVLALMFSTYYEINASVRFVYVTMVQLLMLVVIRIGLAFVQNTALLDVWLLATSIGFLLTVILIQKNRASWRQLL